MEMPLFYRMTMTLATQGCAYSSTQLNFLEAC